MSGVEQGSASFNAEERTIYTAERFYSICDMSQSNYANMLNRLNSRKIFFESILIYYSLSLIVYTIIIKYFPELVDKNFLEFFSLVVSITVLCFSIINQYSNYGIRIVNARNVLDNVKGIKRSLQEGNLEEHIKLYQQIMTTAEYRSELDFFRTLKARCNNYEIKWYRYKRDIKLLLKKETDKKRIYEIKKLNSYLSEVNLWRERAKEIGINILGVILILLPVIALVLAFALRQYIIVKG